MGHTHAVADGVEDSMEVYKVSIIEGTSVTGGWLYRGARPETGDEIEIQSESHVREWTDRLRVRVISVDPYDEIKVSRDG